MARADRVPARRMILSDDNFATIVYAVKQGRKLYDNLSKHTRFVPDQQTPGLVNRRPRLRGEPILGRAE
jgi:hypothetical protein